MNGVTDQGLVRGPTQMGGCNSGVGVHLRLAIEAEKTQAHAGLKEAFEAIFVHGQTRRKSLHRLATIMKVIKDF